MSKVKITFFWVLYQIIWRFFVIALGLYYFTHIRS